MVIVEKFQEGGKPNQFIDNWNKNRLNTGRFNNQLGSEELEQQKASRDSAPIYKSARAFGFNSYIKATPLIMSKSSPKSIEELEQQRRANALNYAANTVKRINTNAQEGRNIQGTYNQNAHTIYAPTEDVLTHEQAHASKAIPQEAKIKEIIGGENNTATPYLDRPTEIYSRLMELRQSNQIDPSKVWTEEEVNKLQGTDFNILNRYKPKQVVKLFNEVAQVPSNSQALFAQEGTAIARQDNTKVHRPDRFATLKAKPPTSKQYYFTQDNRSTYQKEQSDKLKADKERGRTLASNQHLWNMNPTRQVTSQNANSEFQNNKDAIKATMTAGAGAMAITAPIALAGAVTGDWAVDKIVQNHTGKESWGEFMQDKTGIGNSQAWELTNPGGIIGGIYGAEKQVLLGGKKILSKFIKGDADLGWNALDKNHWIFNSATPMNTTLAAANRVAPFLNATEKIPGKIAAYQMAKRTNGNASISIKEALSNSPTYKGTLPGMEKTGKNVLGFYMFNDTPFINKSNWFKSISKRFKPIDGNERTRGFSHGERYDNLYPGLNERRYYMSSVVDHNRSLNLTGEQATNYIGGNIGKTVGKESATVMPRADGKWIKFRDNPKENWVFPLDDVAGHMTKLQYNKGQLKQTSQDLWKFNPKDYSARWSDTPTGTESVRLTKQAALMDKLGQPFILQQSNPIHINNRRILATAMRQGGRFTFRKNPLIKDSEEINGKRDMRKKFIKSNTKHSDYKIRRIRKGASGIKFVSYEEPTSMRNADFSSAFQTDYKFPTLNNYSFKEEQPKEIKEQLPMEEEKKTVPEIKPAKFTGNKDFIIQMKPAFTEALTKRGLDPKYADYLVAQSALESGWGKHQSGKFNFGGIKGKGTVRKTREVINGKDVYINDSFRDFDSINDYADYHVNLLNNKRYNAFNSGDFISSVVKGGYATDPNYKSILSKMYQQVANA